VNSYILFPTINEPSNTDEKAVILMKTEVMQTRNSCNTEKNKSNTQQTVLQTKMKVK
jgi:hypothetical protein